MRPSPRRPHTGADTFTTESRGELLQPQMPHSDSRSGVEPVSLCFYQVPRGELQLLTQGPHPENRRFTG